MTRHWQPRRKPYQQTQEDPLKTGHPLVDAIGCVHLQGFIHDKNWLQHPLLWSECKGTKRVREAGKANLAYQLVWAYLVDMYRPVKLRSPETGEAYALKKFPEEWWATTYSKFGRLLGLTEGQVRKAIALFREREMIGWREAPHARKADKNEKPFEVWPLPDAVRAVTARGEVGAVELGANLKTGNWVCDELLQITLRGDVIDYNWPGHPLMRNDEGATDGLLLLVFAHLFFMHTPTEHTDPVTHRPTPRTKKFHLDALYKSYASWAEQSGLTDDQLRRAVSSMKKKELADVWVAPIIDSGGDLTNNKVHIALQFNKVLELTYGTSHKLVYQKREAPPKTETDSNSEEQSDTPKTGDQSSQSGGHPSQTGDQSSQSGGHPSQTGDVHSNKHRAVPTDISIDISSTTTAEASPVDEEKSHDFLESEEPQKTIQNVKASSTQKSDENVKAKTWDQSYKQTVDAPLPGAAAAGVADGLSAWDALDEPARSLAKRFLEYSSGLGRDVTPEVAMRIISKSPVAKLSSDGLKSWIMRDHERAGLDEPVVGSYKTRFLENEDELRWRLFSWPGHRADVLASQARKKEKNPKILVQAFCYRFDQGMEPPSAWLDEVMADDRREQYRIEWKSQTDAANVFYATLSDAQKRAFELELKLKTQSSGTFVPPDSSEWKTARVLLLNDNDVRERLQNLSSASNGATSSTRSEENAPVENHVPSPKVAERLIRQYAQKLMDKVKANDLSREQLVQECKIIPGVFRDDAPWLADRVLELYELAKAKAA